MATLIEGYIYDGPARHPIAQESRQKSIEVGPRE